MFDEIAVSIATGAAGNVIAYMVHGRIDTLRRQVARIFQHVTESERWVAQ